MNRIRLWKRNFNWRMFVVRILVNMLALLITVAILPNIYFVEKRIVVWIFLALMLGLLNTFVKPLIAFLTLRFIFATGGLVLALINGFILWLLARLFPQMLNVGTLLSALLGGLLIGLASAFIEALLGLNPPIVSEKYPEIRERIKDRQFYRARMVPARLAARSQPSAGELAATSDIETSDSAAPTLEAAPVVIETETFDAGAAGAPGASLKTTDALAKAPPGAAENKTSLSSTPIEPEA